VSPRKLTNVRLDEELQVALQAIKDRDGIPISEQVRRAIRQWVEERGVLKADRKRVGARKRS